MRCIVGVAVAVAMVATPAAASRDNWWFATPSGTAYCGVDNGWVCMRPADGFWLRITGALARNPDVRMGRSDHYRGLRPRAPRTLDYGETFETTDAAVITCWSRRSGVTCKHFRGLSFTLGRNRGYRVFYAAPGRPPDVRPLFRTAHGVRCGIDRLDLEPTSPVLECWRPQDGLVLAVAHDDGGRRGAHRRNEHALGIEPPGFRLLAPGRTAEWRCRVARPGFADRCSQSAGTTVFSCTTTSARLTCGNRNGHGFWVSSRAFSTF